MQLSENEEGCEEPKAKYLLDFGEDNFKKAKNEELEDFLEYYEKNSYGIEVISWSKKLLTMNIIKLPHHKKMMIDRTIKEFEESVDWTNAKTKC